MRPGSLPWLLRFELLLWWREIRGHRAARIILGAFILLAGLMAAAFGFLLRVGLQADEGGDAFPWIWLAVIAFVGLAFLSALTAIPVALAALFDRRDFDLLLASPVTSRTVLAGRLLGIALQLFGNFLWFVLPYSVLVVASGLPQLLGIYPGLGGICLLCACLVTLGLLQLVRWVGLKRARALAQGTLVAFSLATFAGAQLLRLWVARWGSGELDRFSIATVDTPWLSGESWLWFPARTLAGHPGPILLWVGLCAGAATLTVRAMERSFLHGGQQAAASAATVGKLKQPAASWRFSGNLPWILLVKEWRLLWRNPALFSQLGTQIAILGTYTAIYLFDPDFNIDPSIVLAIAQTAFGHAIGEIMTRLTLLGEEAPTLLQASPQGSPKLAAFKLLAALIPTWVLLLPLGAIAGLRGESWLAPMLVGILASSFAGFLALCGSRARPSSELLQQQDGAPKRLDLAVALLSVLSLALWVAISLVLVRGWWLWSLLCWPALAVVAALAYARGRQTGILSQI